MEAEHVILAMSLLINLIAGVFFVRTVLPLIQIKGVLADLKIDVAVSISRELITNVKAGENLQRIVREFEIIQMFVPKGCYDDLDDLYTKLTDEITARKKHARRLREELTKNEKGKLAQTSN